MAKGLKSIDISHTPELLRLAEEVQRTQEPTVLVNEAQEMAVVIPIPTKRKRSTKGRPVTEDDPQFRLIGIARSGIPGGVSGKKHEYLARAFRSHIK